MIELPAAEVVAATRAEPSVAGGLDPATLAGLTIGSVVTDSREVRPGSLFVALPGERTDGHDHAAAAVAAGAVAVLAGRHLSGPDGRALPVLRVPDPLVALGQLTRAVLDHLPELTVIGVTGSSGKTSTKDLLAHLLADLGPTVAPQNSFNNELGVPLTALRCTEQTRYLVAEMGAREPGNIAYLCAIVAPRIGVVLNVGAAHAGVFGDRAATAATKGELVEALPPSGVAVLTATDPLVRAMAGRTRARVLLVGEGGQVQARGVRLDDQARAAFDLVTPEGAWPVQLRLHGAHQVGNALAAAAVALECGARPERVAELLGTAAVVSQGRMAVHDRPDGVRIVDDAYNANPDSMAAALRALAAMTPAGRRSWAVLGEMLELGPAGPAEHAAIGALAGRLGIDRLLAVGEGARAYLTGAGTEQWVPDPAAGIELLRAELRPGDVVLTKASRAIGLDSVAGALRADGEQAALRADGVPVRVPADRSGEDVSTTSGNDEEER